jgi:tetratricopeptide (TPR) repeat protein
MEISDEYLLADQKENLIKVAKKLKQLREETDHGAILITKGKKKDKVVGFITKREILEVVGASKDPEKTKATEAMSTDFLEVYEDDSLDDIIPSISELYPNAVVVTNKSGKFVGFFSKNDYKDALAAMGIYDEKHKPQSKDDWRTRGIALSARGDNKEAMKCFNKSVGEGKESDKKWTGLAKRLERLNRIKESLLCYDKALSINKNNEDALIEKGHIYQNENSDNQAINSYKMALDINPNNTDALMNMGMEQANMGSIEEAMATLDKAVKVEGETPELWFKRGVVYDKAKKYNDSLECYNKAIEINDYYEEAWYNKGVALNNLKRYNDAVQCMMKILMINPMNETARENLNSFKEQGTMSV